MIESAKIKNFKCFRSTELAECRRLNVVVGENASGKTALLEAMFLATWPNPHLVIRIRQWRGYEGTFAGLPREIEDAIWRDLFHQFDKTNPVSISLSGPWEDNRSLSISYAPTELLIPLDEDSSSDMAEPISVIFEWRGPGGKVIRVEPKIVAGKLEIPPIPETPINTFFFAANRTYSSAETAARFSALSKRSKHHDAVKLFSKIFPTITGLSIEVLAGTPMVFAESLAFTEKVPLNLVSGGINKLASILFAIPSAPGCLVLIDEIESGFYHDMLSDVWKALLLFCKRYDAQVFATTHSQECLQALAEASVDSEDDVSLIRMERQEDGNVLVREFAGSSFRAGMEIGTEVR